MNDGSRLETGTNAANAEDRFQLCQNACLLIILQRGATDSCCVDSLVMLVENFTLGYTWRHSRTSNQQCNYLQTEYSF